MQSKSVISVLLYILGLSFNLALLAVVAFAVYTFAMDGFEFGGGLAEELVAIGDDYEVEFVLHEETSASDVARELEELGIINNRLLFQLETFLMGRVRVYQPGTFLLNRSMNNTEVHRALRTPPPPEQGHHVITIPEGWTVRDIALYLDENRGFFSAEEFMYEVENGHFSFTFLNEIPSHPDRPRLEGYLFPDTYWISLSPTPREVILNMLHRFEDVFDDARADRAYELGMSMDEVIIIASIISNRFSQ